MTRFLNSLNIISVTQWLTVIRLFTVGFTLKIPIAFIAISVLPPRLRRRQTDQPIPPSEDLFAVFMDNLPGYAWMKDRAGRYLYVNRGVKSLAPYRNGWLGNTDAEIWPGDAAAAFRKNDLHVVETGEKVETIESFFLNGEQRHLLVTKFPIFDEQGTVTMVGGTGVDITEHKRVEEALRESESFRRMIIESEPECVKLVALDYRLLDMNPAGLEMIGATSREQVLGQSVLNLVAPEFRSTYEGMHQRVCQGESVVAEFEIIGLNGSRRRMESHGAPLLDRQSRVVAHLAITRDVTERRRAVEELRESEERFRQLSEAAFETIIFHDNGTILEVNQSFCRMYGYERAEVIGKSVLDLALPQYREQLLQIVRSGDTDPYESPALRKDGTTFNAEVAGKPINYQGRVVRVAAIRDITAQKRNERRQAAQYAVTRVLAESATLADAMPKLLRVICESLRWKMGEFWRVSDSKNLLRCVETWHAPALDAMSFIEASRQTELAPGVGLPGRLWQSGQPAWIPDVTADSGFARAAIACNLGLRGAVGFPIVLGNDTLGVMQFFSRRSPDVDEDLLKMMSAISSQIGQFTERKRAEEQLRQAEERYRSIFENAVEGIFQSTPDGRFIAANPALARMYGFDSPEELISTRTDIAQELYVDPKSREEFKRSMEENGFVLDFEIEAYRKDGSKIWISENVRAVRDQAGKVVYYEGTTQDITARKLAEQALRKSEERYRELFENAKDGIYVHDLSGMYKSVNRAIEKLSGYSREEILGKDSSSFVAPEYLQRVQENFCKKLRQEGETSYEVEIITKEGRRVPVEVNSNLIFENGSPVGVQALVRDIAERRSAEEALRQAEQKFRSIFENAGEGIFQSTPEGRYISANPKLARMLGFASPEELICDRHDISHQVYVEPTRREEFKRLLEENGAVRGFEHQVFRKDGSKIWISVNARAVRDDHGQIVYYEGTAQDVTERKRAEAALKNYSRLLIGAQEAERQNIARELHDQIGQLLTAIHFNLQTVRDSSETERSKALTDEGMHLVDHALGQVRDLSFKLRPSLLDDLGLIAALRWYADRFTQRTGIRTSRVIELAGKRLPRDLETACFRVVQEALTNVARHAGAKEVVINLRMLEQEIFLSIKDDGCGFDTSSINSRSFPIRLGLRGMEERALALGGRLGIESAPAEGTEILAYFPNEETNGHARGIIHSKVSNGSSTF